MLLHPEAHLNTQKPRWLIIAFAASLLAVGIPSWLVPYNQVNLPDTLMKPGLTVVVSAALLLNLYGAASFWKTVRIVGSSAPVAVFARVLVDGVRDPTSHNLRPCEVIIALLLGFIRSLAGAVFGSLVARVVPVDTKGTRS